MNTPLKCAALLAAFFVVSLSFGDDRQFTEQKIYDLEGLESLSLDFNHAEIEMTQNSGATLDITMIQTLKRGDKDSCLHVLSDERAGKALKVLTGYSSQRWTRNCNVHRTIKVLVGTAALQRLALDHGHSTLELQDIKMPNFELLARHSGVRVGAIVASMASLDCRHGSLNIESAQSDNIRINGAHGKLKIAVLNSAEFEGSWRHGSVSLLKSQVGTVNFTSGHGAVYFDNHTGDTLNLSNRHGKIKANGLQLENVTLRNKHGPIVFSGGASRLEAYNGHGAIKLVQTAAKFDIVSHNNHGNIKIQLPKGSQYNYAMNAKSVKINDKKLQAYHLKTQTQATPNHIQINSSHGQVVIDEI
ncbi:MAG: DUF4097 family beta strand repeat protein [Cellvibrionaceae bacterium]|nr:DUF4097 family beta strand repeat protein [Cellvibrionaceae bacterium]